MPHRIRQKVKADQSGVPAESPVSYPVARPASIKHKLITSLLIVYFLSSLATIFAIYSLAKVEAKIDIIGLFDEISQKVLETRRYEKNFLLYNNDEDLRITLDYLDKVRADINNLKTVTAFPQKDLPEYIRRLEDYADSLEKLKARADMP